MPAGRCASPLLTRRRPFITIARLSPVSGMESAIVPIHASTSKSSGMALMSAAWSIYCANLNARPAPQYSLYGLESPSMCGSQVTAACFGSRPSARWWSSTTTVLPCSVAALSRTSPAEMPLSTVMIRLFSTPSKIESDTPYPSVNLRGMMGRTLTPMLYRSRVRIVVEVMPSAS